MKKLKIEPKLNIYSVVILLIIFIFSCTDDFSEINTDKNTISSNKIGSSELKYLFSGAVEKLPIGYQTSQNLYADQYAQYIANNATYFPTDRLFINMGWARGAFNPIYTTVMPQLHTILENSDSTSAEYALA